MLKMEGVEGWVWLDIRDDLKVVEDEAADEIEAGALGFVVSAGESFDGAFPDCLESNIFLSKM